MAWRGHLFLGTFADARFSLGERAASYEAAGKPLPLNKGEDKKLRELDCAVINECVYRVGLRQHTFDTVRGAFLEGPPIFPGTTISAETYIQIALRNLDCILGVFRPNLREEERDVPADT